MKKILLLAGIILSMMILSNCEYEKSSGYWARAVYDSIRSFPEGGGNFILYINTGQILDYKYTLSLTADPKLNAKLNRNHVHTHDSVFEVTINPAKDCEIKDYKITVGIKKGREMSTTDLIVTVCDWESNNFDYAQQKKELFKNYLLSIDQNYSEVFDTTAFTFGTYPEIVIVEHYTYLTQNYEVRLCYHVMTPPDDWAKIRIRKRNSIEPELALYCATDGTVTEINIVDYPTFFGY